MKAPGCSTHPGVFFRKSPNVGAFCFLRVDGIGQVERKRGGTRKSERCLALRIHPFKIHLPFLSKNAIVWEVRLSSEQTSYMIILKIWLI